MKAIRIHSLGTPDVLKYEDAPDPVLREPDEVIVAVKAASVNAADWKVRSGKSGTVSASLPHILGRDFSGVVLAAGPAADLAVGDEVFGVFPGGTEGAYAEKVVIAAGLLARKPSVLSHAQAAAVALAGTTALISLEDTIKLKAGEKILVQGGAGGVGGMAVQIARYLGATVAATARSANQDYLRTLGADHPIDYTRQDPASAVSGYDAAFDTIGGDCVAQSFAVLRSGGRAASVATTAMPAAPRAEVQSLRPAILRGRVYLERLASYLQSGAIRPPEITTFPLAEARQAHVLSEQGHVRGKIVLLP